MHAHKKRKNGFHENIDYKSIVLILLNTFSLPVYTCKSPADLLSVRQAMISDLYRQQVAVKHTPHM